jgi:hypothetical protein
VLQVVVEVAMQLGAAKSSNAANVVLENSVWALAMGSETVPEVPFVPVRPSERFRVELGQ